MPALLACPEYAAVGDSTGGFLFDASGGGAVFLLFLKLVVKKFDDLKINKTLF